MRRAPLHWLRSHGFLVVTKEGAPADEAHYKANVDVLMAIDAVELSTAAAHAPERLAKLGLGRQGCDAELTPGG